MTGPQFAQDALLPSGRARDVLCQRSVSQVHGSDLCIYG